MSTLVVQNSTHKIARGLLRHQLCNGIESGGTGRRLPNFKISTSEAVGFNLVYLQHMYRPGINVILIRFSNAHHFISGLPVGQAEPDWLRSDLDHVISTQARYYITCRLPRSKHGGLDCPDSQAGAWVGNHPEKGMIPLTLIGSFWIFRSALAHCSLAS